MSKCEELINKSQLSYISTHYKLEIFIHLSWISFSRSSILSEFYLSTSETPTTWFEPTIIQFFHL